MMQTDTAATTRVLLVDNHALLRRGMRDALRDEGLRVVGEAGSWDELQPLLHSVAVDVLVLDSHLPGPAGLDVLNAIKKQPSPPHTLVMSTDAEGAYAAQASRAGAGGYLSKSCDIAALVDAIRTVAQGRQYVAPAIAARLADPLTASAQHLPQRFSEREQQLLAMLACGRRLPDIAERLELPAKAVSVYRARLLEKMKLSTNAELAHYAIRHNLVAAAA
jgi:two-component system invasion response regulator UvrY